MANYPLSLSIGTVSTFLMVSFALLYLCLMVWGGVERKIGTEIGIERGTAAVGSCVTDLSYFSLVQRQEAFYLKLEKAKAQEGQ